MEYATLNNGMKMPMAGIGTFLLTPDEAEASCVSALQNGYRLIDTANAYVNEKAVGRAMKKSGLQREEIFLETKLWPSFYEQPDAVDKTLARLDTPYIDLLLIHQPAGNYVAGYRQMEKAYKEGKVRAIGLSNFKKEQIEEILSLCEVKPTILQTELHPYHQEPELKVFLKENGIVPQAWYPLGHGDKALLEEPLFAELGKKYGKSAPQVILRWHIQSGNIVIPGSKNPEHIKSNFDLFDFALTDDEMAQVTALNKNVRYYVFTFLPKHGGYEAAQKTHILCAYWGFVCMSLHLGLHWSMMLAMARKHLQPSPLRTWCLRLIGWLWALYGAFAFHRRGVGLYLLLRSHFVFYNYSEPVIFFLIDYLSVMAMFTLIGYYISQGIKKLTAHTPHGIID